MQSWEWQQFFTYVKLKKQTDVHALEVKFQNDVTQKSNPPASKVNFKNKPLFQPLKDIHLYSSGFKFDMAQRGNITYVNGLSITGVFILLIACFNFVNLATARSLQRAKEVGIRKTIGASRHGLMLQFMGETLLLSCISMLIATCLAVLLLPLLNDFTSKHIPASLLAKPFVLLLLVGSMLLTGLFAGFYPAIVLSGFKAVRVLKGVASSEQQPGKIPWLRHGLVVVQFTL
ncbi:MAG TPA: FtsX-like permease family protein, partial [Puia sp.]|nr:FtsX-like permease family protein [Puia sp.]